MSKVHGFSLQVLEKLTTFLTPADIDALQAVTL